LTLYLYLCFNVNEKANLLKDKDAKLQT